MQILEKELDNELSLAENEEVVIQGFMDRYDVDYEEAKEIFEETKKFLELASDMSQEGQSLFVDKPLLIIDEMWHTFILHTKQYMQFCLGKFNRFIHHVPTSNKEKMALNERLSTNPSLVLQEQEEKLKDQYSRIYDKFGADTLLKWYETWPTKYTPEYIGKIKKAV
ncbi:glycine-rich domain-containing protein [Fulvivirga lutea]|uniref:Uncharacterized protein n=1 Tax=Fulvivirga lutea TaxID=2810512 RepID=A0A975A053_9BACT|nr:hypothetical protein [Fulvivirga lutea]QSE96102.1 hypothetical protein JR347_10785 [Fulvivirga lutea]